MLAGFDVKAIFGTADHCGALVDMKTVPSPSIQVVPAEPEGFTVSWTEPPNDAVESWTIEWRRVQSNPGFYHPTANTAIGSSLMNFTKRGNFGVSNGRRCEFTKLTPGVTGFATGVRYYVVNVLTNSFELAKDQAGTEIVKVAGAELVAASTEWRFTQDTPTPRLVANVEAWNKSPATNKLPSATRSYTVTNPTFVESWPNASNLVEVQVLANYKAVSVPAASITQTKLGGERIELEWPDTLNSLFTPPFKEPGWRTNYRRPETVGAGVKEKEKKLEVQGNRAIIQLRPWEENYKPTGTTAIGASFIPLASGGAGAGGAAAKGFAAGQKVKFLKVKAGVTAPAVGTTYYVKTASETGIELSLTPGGPAVVVAGHAMEVTGTELEVQFLAGEPELELKTTKGFVGVAGIFVTLFQVRIGQVRLPKAEPQLPEPQGGVPYSGPEYPKVGDVLKVTGQAAWTAGPVTTAKYQWYTKTGMETAPIQIPGATGTSYTVQSGDVGQWIEVEEYAANANGTAYYSASSEPTREIRA
jgi:hypothetical protein